MKIVVSISLLVGIFLQCGNAVIQIEVIESDSKILHHVVDFKKSEISFFLKDSTGEHYKNANNLKQELEAQGKELFFCMNGGMFTPAHEPAGLYIENGKELQPINLVKKAPGNFHLMPNGVFYITETNQAGVCVSTEFTEKQNVKFATQSGPMLLIDGEYHSAFNEGSKNRNIRNGVGVLPDGRLLFAMSTERVSFYDFATFFKANGCQNALYLDGAISRTYLPEKGENDLGGNFGVLIGEVR